MQKWSLSGPFSICEGGAGVEPGISGGPLSPEGLGHGGPQGPSGTEDGEAGESLEDRSRYAPTIKGTLGTRGDPETHSPRLAGGSGLGGGRCHGLLSQRWKWGSWGCSSRPPTTGAPSCPPGSGCLGLNQTGSISYGSGPPAGRLGIEGPRNRQRPECECGGSHREGSRNSEVTGREGLPVTSTVGHLCGQHGSRHTM